MKNIILKSLFFFGLLALVTSCEEKTEPDFGYDAVATYTVLINFAGQGVTDAQKFIAGAEFSKTLSVSELNAKLLALGVEPEVETVIDVIVETKLSKYKQLYSEPVQITLTAYPTILDLSTEWGVVGDATPGGWGATATTPIKDIPFWTTGVDGIYVAYGTVKDGFVKFRTNNEWTLNYGDDGEDGTLDGGGSNIAIAAGTYKFTINLNDLTYVIEPYSWGLVGSFNDWNAPDHKLTYNPYADDWKAVISFPEDASVKFRMNEDWAENYGDDGADGTLDGGGSNIEVPAGHYLVTFNPVEQTYAFESMDVWGLVGSATPNGWDGPDTKFLPDFGVNDGMYYINGITLTDGEIKIRQNDAWALNYGDGGMQGDLYLLSSDNAGNIPVTAGIYNIELNLSVTPPTLGIYPWQ
ncbi:MAG: hypothetical protein CSA40_01740 [Flavobacteriales bacterium]|nr:MAG: hypothetical protein CSA40_01740 [Flavobacteriales bacterium]